MRGVVLAVVLLAALGGVVLAMQPRTAAAYGSLPFSLSCAQTDAASAYVAGVLLNAREYVCVDDFLSDAGFPPAYTDDIGLCSEWYQWRSGTTDLTCSTIFDFEQLRFAYGQAFCVVREELWGYATRDGIGAIRIACVHAPAAAAIILGPRR